MWFCKIKISNPETHTHTHVWYVMNEFQIKKIFCFHSIIIKCKTKHVLIFVFFSFFEPMEIKSDCTYHLYVVRIWLSIYRKRERMKKNIYEKRNTRQLLKQNSNWTIIWMKKKRKSKTYRGKSVVTLGNIFNKVEKIFNLSLINNDKTCSMMT